MDAGRGACTAAQPGRQLAGQDHAAKRRHRRARQVRHDPDTPRDTDAQFDLPVSGAPVRFFVAGEFGRPSVTLGDTTIEARGTGSLGVLGSKPVTVRIRKDAADAHAPPSATGSSPRSATLNGGGSGRFRDFRDMHRERRRPRGARQRRASSPGTAPTCSTSSASAGDRSERGAAVLAVRPAGAEAVHPRVHGVPNSAGRLQFTRRTPVRDLAHRRRSSGSSRRPSFATAARAPAC